MELKTKCSRCRNNELNFETLKEHCTLDYPGFTTEINIECESFDSRYIEYPLTIEGIDNNFTESHHTHWHKCGTLVKISPCADEYKGKTYLGILLGDFPISNHICYNRETKRLEVNPHYNPAIFIPETKTIVYGCGSWWGAIRSEEEFKEITKEDIDNTWYVKMLKELAEKSD